MIMKRNDVMTTKKAKDSHYRPSKGIAMSIEAIIAASILLVAAAAMFASPPGAGASTTKYSAYAALAELDKLGGIRQLVASDNAAGIKTELQPWLEDIEVEICSPVCSGPSRSGAVAIDWFVSGQSTLDPKRLRVYVFA
jgi:hypothetical protein